ncbi:MAG: cupin domain-containing protein [Desulfovibrio sp.]|nr:cupin domain-containing protein [Desulfovibrio sp.]
MNNLLELPPAAAGAGREFAETLLTGAGGLRLERIVTLDDTGADAVWYDQAQDEWVAVLEGEATLGFADGREAVLVRGSCIFLPKHVRHRVLRASAPCIWLAVHSDALRPACQAPLAGFQQTG